jgi:hypothetical protein
LQQIPSKRAGAYVRILPERFSVSAPSAAHFPWNVRASALPLSSADATLVPLGSCRSAERGNRDPIPTEIRDQIMDGRAGLIVSLKRLHQNPGKSDGRRILCQNAPQCHEQGMVWDNQQDSFYDPNKGSEAGHTLWGAPFERPLEAPRMLE